MDKVIYLDSQEIKNKLKEKCFNEISKTLFNFEDSSSKRIPVMSIIKKQCKKYKVTKNEFISYCKSIKQWDFFDKLPWQQHDF